MLYRRGDGLIRSFLRRSGLILIPLVLFVFIELVYSVHLFIAELKSEQIQILFYVLGIARAGYHYDALAYRIFISVHVCGVDQSASVLEERFD